MDQSKTCHLVKSSDPIFQSIGHLYGLVTYFLCIAGYARLSNVEFYHTGQEGFTEEYDPRFSLSYVAVGTVSNVKPSSVTKCSFHNGFNTAIGAFGIGSLNVTDNVVFGTVGNGMSLILYSIDTHFDASATDIF